MNSTLLRHLMARTTTNPISSLVLAGLLLAAPVAAFRAGGGNEPALKGGGNNTGPSGASGQTIPIDLCAGATTGGPAGGGGIALPLASVGKEVGWKIGPEDYRLVVPAAAAGRETSLEVYSPEINLNDYANKRNRIAYYGDEVYAKGASVVTKFTLKEALKPTSSLRKTLAGRQALAQAAGVLSDKRYSLGNQHSWDKLFEGTLEPGVYPLNIQTFGLGKNAFALRATNGMRVEASQFGVTARGACNQDQLVGFIPVGKSALGKKFTISNYDADGNSELILTAVLPDGSRRRLTSSGDTQWAMDMFKITEKDLGQWKILARIQPTTKQYSNSFEMRLELDGKPFYGQLPGFKPQTPPPAPVAKIGKLEVKSVAVVCEQRVPLSGTGFNTAGKAFTAPLALELPVGSYDVTPQALAGASVEPLKVNVTDGQTTAVELVYKVENTISLEPGSLELQVGETGTVTATVSNGFATPLPASIKIKLPEGLTAEGPTEFTGNVSSTQPLKVSVPVKADAPVSGTITASLEKDCGTDASSEVVVLGTPEIQIDKVVDQDLVKAGDEVNFTITVTNVGNATAEDVLVEDELPAGLEGENLSETITLEPGESQTFELPATVSEQASDTIDNTATATLGDTTVDASAGIVIEPPPGSPVIEIDKSVDQDLVQAGDEVNYTIIVSNTGESIAEDVLVEDELPAGLEGENLSETITLEPGESQTFELPATVTEDASDTIDNTATATLGENTVDSSASIVIEPPPVAPPPAEPQADVSISKDVAPILAAPGDEVEYTLVIENNGPDAAEDVIVNDNPPEGLEITDVSSDVGTAEVRDGAAYAELGTLEAGENATVTVTATVTSEEEGFLENIATVETSTTETDLENNESPATLEVRLPEPEPVAPVVQKGILDFTSIAQSCGQEVDFPSNVTVNGQTVSTDETLELDPGEYEIQPEGVAGSSVEPLTVTVFAGETTTADVVYQPVSRVTLTSSDENVNVGDEVILEATAETDFPGELSGTLSLELPDGLETQDELSSEGTYSADNPLVLTVVAKATKPITDGVVFATLDGCDISENVVINATKVAVPLPPAKRESQITSLARISEAPMGSQVIIANKLPEGATYIPGSSRQLTSPNFDVNAQPVDGMWNAASDQPSTPLPEPLISGDTLFWALPADGMTYGVTYRVAHESAITFPPNCRAVILAMPGGSSANQYRENGLHPSSTAGKLVDLGDFRLLQGDKVYLTSFASARPAELGAALTAVGGPASAIRITALRNSTEPVDQPSLLIEAFDTEGNPANDGYVTLTVSPDPYDPDASPMVGYQAKLVNGSALVRLQPVGPGPQRDVTQPEITAEARITHAAGTVSSSATFRSVDVTGPSLAPSKAGVEGASRGWIIVGSGGIGLSGTFGSASSFSVDGSIKALARGPIINDILLTAAINQNAAYNFTDGSFKLGGSLSPNANPYERFPLLGDSSRVGSDARSGDGFYVRLEKGLSNLTYGTVNPGFQGLLTDYQPQFTGATGNLNAGIFNLRGFAAYVPNATQFRKIAADGTDLYRVSSAASTDLAGAGVVDGSERISVVTYDRNAPTLRLEERLLARGADYTVDYASGTIKLARPIYSNDLNGNPVFIEVYYASAGPATKSDWRYGAQAGVNLGSINVTGTYIGVQPSLNLFGIGASYAAQGFGIALEGTQSGGKLGVAGRLNVQSGGFEAQIRYQDLEPGYIDPNSLTTTQGRALTAAATFGSPDGFSLTGRFAQNVNYLAGLTKDSGSLEARYSFGRDGFTIAAGLLGNVDLNNNVQLDSKYYASLGIQAPLGPVRLGLTQLLGLSKGSDSQTLISIDYALSPNFGIRLADTLTYQTAGIRQQISLGARGSFSNTELLRTALGNTPEIPIAFGTTNIAASYDLDTVDGNASRARVGVDTNLPLSTNFSLLLGAEATLPASGNATYAGNFGVLYASEAIKGSARAGFSLTGDKLKQVYTLGGIFQPSDTLAFSPSLEYTRGGSEGDGGRFSIAGAIRQDDWTLVTNNTGKFGFYAPSLGNSFEGEVRFGYQAAERLFVRAGFGYGIAGPKFMGQIGGGLTYYFTETLGLGVNAAYQFSPAYKNGTTDVPNTSDLLIGIEGSLRLLTGLNLNAGFNIGGKDTGIGTNPYLLSPGFYIRLEWKFDERTFGR